MISGKDPGAHGLNVLAQVVDIARNLAAAMEIVDRGSWDIFHKEGGQIQTTKPDQEVNKKTMKMATKRVEGYVPSNLVSGS